MEDRLPAHLEVSGLIRQVTSAGGFATVLHKGERDAGTILVILAKKGRQYAIYERLPKPDGRRIWSAVGSDVTEKYRDYGEWLARRSAFDPDLWIVELDIANGERFIGLTGTRD